jgi:hypothetical protein
LRLRRIEAPAAFVFWSRNPDCTAPDFGKQPFRRMIGGSRE